MCACVRQHFLSKNGFYPFKSFWNAERLARHVVTHFSESRATPWRFMTAALSGMVLVHFVADLEVANFHSRDNALYGRNPIS